jgi:hypothetical protein
MQLSGNVGCQICKTLHTRPSNPRDSAWSLKSQAVPTSGGEVAIPDAESLGGFRGYPGNHVDVLAGTRNTPNTEPRNLGGTMPLFVFFLPYLVATRPYLTYVIDR